MADSDLSPLAFIAPDWPAPARVRAVATTRTGGCGRHPYSSFNVALHVGDREADVAENRRRLGEQLQLDRPPCWLTQVHGRETVSANEGAGSEADGSFTRSAGVACAVMVADCLPLLICDRRGTRVAAAHAGWRGLAAGIVEAIVARFDDPGDLLAWLGPAIGPCHYEVGEEVRAAFGKAPAGFAAGVRAGHWQMDLYAVARERLGAAGVAAVYGGDYCTHCDEERFFSYRRDGTTGRNASLIWLTE